MKVKGVKRKKAHTTTKPSIDQADNTNVVGTFLSLSLEVLVHIFENLPVQTLLRLESTSRRIQAVVNIALKQKTVLDFRYGSSSARWKDPFIDITAVKFTKILKRLPNLQYIYNLNVRHERLNSVAKTVKGFVAALAKCKRLKAVEIRDCVFLEHLVSKLPRVEIIGCLAKIQRVISNEPSDLIPAISQLPHGISRLHLVGCSVHSLPDFRHQLKSLYLSIVQFLEEKPFTEFSAPGLESFVMSNCIGPVHSVEYLPLLDTLGECRGLKRLELQKLPIQEGMLQTACEMTCQRGGFRCLETLTLGNCYRLRAHDAGFLIISSARSLETIQIQPSLSTDTLFASLIAAGTPGAFPFVEHLSLGWEFSFLDSVRGTDWIGNALTPPGALPIQHVVAHISDLGVQMAGRCFPALEKLELHKCPFLKSPLYWTEHGNDFCFLRDLTLDSCPNIPSWAFMEFLPRLSLLRYLSLENMFREAPVGCSRVKIKTQLKMQINGMVARGSFPGSIDVEKVLNAFPDSGTLRPTSIALPNQNPSNQNQRLQPSAVKGQSSEAMSSHGKEGYPEPVEKGCKCVPKRDVGCQAEKQLLIKSLRWLQKNRNQQNDPAAGTSIEKVPTPGTSHECATDRIITPRPYQPSGNHSVYQRSECCRIHGSRRRMLDMADSTCDPVRNDEEDIDIQVLKIKHNRLEHLYLGDVGITGLTLHCPNLNTLNITKCRVLQTVNLTFTPDLSNTEVTQCPRFDESYFMNSVYKLPPKCSRFVSLRPMHPVSLDCTDVRYGSLVTFDYSNHPGETNHNMQLAQDWTSLFEDLTRRAVEQHGCEVSAFCLKGVYTLLGDSQNGKRWVAKSDIPWPKLLKACVARKRQKGSIFSTAVPSREALYEAMGSFVEQTDLENMRIHKHNVITYINLCDSHGEIMQMTNA